MHEIGAHSEQHTRTQNANGGIEFNFQTAFNGFILSRKNFTTYYT